MIIISDTTPILSLLKVRKLELLEMLYHTVVVPEAVYNELTSNDNYSAEEIRETLEILLRCDIRLSRKLCNKVLRYVGLEGYF